MGFALYGKEGGSVGGGGVGLGGGSPSARIGGGGFSARDNQLVAHVALVFGNTDNLNFDGQFFECFNCRTNLTLAPVNKYQVRERPFFVPETPFKYFA